MWSDPRLVAGNLWQRIGKPFLTWPGQQLQLLSDMLSDTARGGPRIGQHIGQQLRLIRSAIDNLIGRAPAPTGSVA
eukprot:2229348-Alexandrium_andersonii.AAC.1